MKPDMPAMLITGTSRGIGNYLAQYYLEKGCAVFGCSRQRSDIDHENFIFFEADLSQEPTIELMFDALKTHTRKLDVVINNAGMGSMNLLNLTPYATADKIFSINVLGTFSILQKSVRFLKKSRNPRIVNFSTVAVPLRLSGESLYAASKSAVETMTRILAKELAGLNITCNAVGPAPIQTDLIKGVGEEKIAALLKQQAIHRLAEFRDVANVIDFFIAPQSDMVTGQVVYLGGVG
jgi:3-oxoacyl-[acyl-carrier protein] reductase